VISEGRAVRGFGSAGGEAEGCSPPCTLGGEGRALIVRVCDDNFHGEVEYREAAICDCLLGRSIGRLLFADKS